MKQLPVALRPGGTGIRPSRGKPVWRHLIKSHEVHQDVQFRSGGGGGTSPNNCGSLSEYPFCSIPCWFFFSCKLNDYEGLWNLKYIVCKGGPPSKPWDLFIKNCVFVCTCLNLSHLQSALHLMQYIYWDIFSHCSEQFLNSLILIPFSASAIFCFTSSTWAKCFPLRTSFILGNKKTGSGQNRLNREGGAWEVMPFWGWKLSTVWGCGQVHL